MEKDSFQYVGRHFCVLIKGRQRETPKRIKSSLYHYQCLKKVSCEQFFAKMASQFLRMCSILDISLKMRHNARQSDNNRVYSVDQTSWIFFGASRFYLSNVCQENRDGILHKTDCQKMVEQCKWRYEEGSSPTIQAVSKNYSKTIERLKSSFMSRHVFKTRPNSARVLLSFPVTYFPIRNRFKI